jgi:hypothetical protein
VYGGRVIAEQGDMCIGNGTDFFHYQPKHQQTCHFQIRVCDSAVRVIIRDNAGRDVLRPLETKHCGCGRAIFTNYNTAQAMARRVRYANVIWPSGDQVSTLRWGTGRFS